MKTKKFEKKLTLNKKTIADLKNDEMKKLQGGIYKSMRRTECTCVSCPTEPCNTCWETFCGNPGC